MDTLACTHYKYAVLLLQLQFMVCKNVQVSLKSDVKDRIQKMHTLRANRTSKQANERESNRVK